MMRQKLWHKIRHNIKNPFAVSFWESTLICCVVLILLFFCINASNVKKAQRQLHQDQINLLMTDWNDQLGQLKNITLKIRINTNYQPFYLDYNKYQEKELLDDFKQYSNYSVLTDECFLYYQGRETIFHSSGWVKSLDSYMLDYSEEDKEKMLYAISQENEFGIHTTDSALWILSPIKFDIYSDDANAVLVFKIDNSVLAKRFQHVTGGLTGTIALYQKEELLYCNQQIACLPGQRNVLTVESEDGQYMICYRSLENQLNLVSISTSQYLLLTVIVVLLLCISVLFARKSYRPVQNIAEKYGAFLPENYSLVHADALEKIDSQLDHMQKKNISITRQISESQTMLRRQLLHDLLHGRMNNDLLPHLEKVQVYLPGPYYYVLSVQFEESDDSDGFIEELQEEIEQQTQALDHIFAYTIANREKLRINVVCSIQDKKQEKQLTEYVCEIINSASYRAVIGLGSPYRDICKISASWLESIDNIHNTLNARSADAPPEENWTNSILSSEKRQRFFFYLANGSEELAYEEFQEYMVLLENREFSFLLQQYMFSSFLSEFGKIAATKGITIDNRNLALILSAGELSAFKDAVQSMMLEYFSKYNQMLEQKKQETVCEICDYLNSHFMEYDISVERIAEYFHTNTTEVRQAIVSHTGYKYKEYVISLRIELAKKLLLTSSLPIAEICKQVGYSNVSYFVTLFKKQTEMSPAEYRNYYKNS